MPRLNEYILLFGGRGTGIVFLASDTTLFSQTLGASPVRAEGWSPPTANSGKHLKHEAW